jgi:uncharacterized protein (TIRG00374 family)
MRRIAVVLLKLAVAAVLIGWLLYAGTLDFASLHVFLDDPVLPLEDLGILAFAIVLGAMRWRMLLRLVGVQLGAARALQLHMTGLFFSIVIPGGVGGDVVRAIYVAREEPAEKRAAVYLVGLVDRLAGVGGLVMLAMIVLSVRGSSAWAAPMRGLSILVIALASMTVVVPIAVLWFTRRSHGDFDRGILGRIIGATRLVASRPAVLLGALALAIAVHIAGMALFTMLAKTVSSHEVSAPLVASVYPLGMLTTALPISTAGIGVGHVAFERLFTLVGLDGGANVFNLFLIGQTAPCLLGVIPYVALRRRSPPPTAVEAARQQA